MFRIFKYPLTVEDVGEIEMPRGASILTVQVQGGVPCIWATVDDERPLEVRHFRLIGTGHPMDIEPCFSRYIGTFQLGAGSFIGHLFEYPLRE